MTGYLISPSVCYKENIPIGQAFLLLCIYFKGLESFEGDIVELGKRGLVDICDIKFPPSSIPSIHLTEEGINFAEKLFLNSEFKEETDKGIFKTLAQKMMDLFPEGNMPNTNYKWRGNLTTIEQRLKSFKKKFEGEYTEEQILQATAKYVEDYSKQDYKYMQLLKYFIWKEDPVKGLDSQLASYLEDSSKGPQNDLNWSTNLVC